MTIAENYYIPKTFSSSHSLSDNSGVPYARKAYARGSLRFDIPEAGFPTVKAPIHPWIPGVSTPEGIMLAAGASALVVNTISASSEALFHVAQGLASFAMVGIVGGIPTSAIWLSTKLLAHHS